MNRKRAARGVWINNLGFIIDGSKKQKITKAYLFKTNKVYSFDL